MPFARLLPAAVIASLLSGCATTSPSLDRSAPLPPASLIIERTPDLFVVPPSRNYPRSLFAFFVKPQFQTTRLGRVVVGSGVSSAPVISPASLLLTNVANGLLINIETNELREVLYDYDLALSAPRYGAQLDATFSAALRDTLWPNVAQVVPVALADELPPGRPDYREVTSEQRARRRSIEEDFRIELHVRPSIIASSGQVSVRTTLKYRNNTHPAFPRKFRAQAAVYSQSIGRNNLGFWLDNDRANLKRFYECAAAESMDIFKLAMEGAYQRDQDGGQIKHEDLFRPEGRMPIFFASQGDVLERSGHRVRVAFVGDFFGSVIIDPADPSIELPTLAERNALSACRVEPIFEQ